MLEVKSVKKRVLCEYIYGSNLYLFELNLGLVVRHGLVCSSMYPQIHCNIKKKRRVYLFFFILCIIFFKDPNYLKLNSVLFLQSF